MQHPFRNSPIKQRIYDYLVKRPDGANTREIMDYVYADDPDGGPENGNIISVHVNQMKVPLGRAGIKITNTMGPAAVYYLTKSVSHKET